MIIAHGHGDTGTPRTIYPPTLFESFRKIRLAHGVWQSGRVSKWKSGRHTANNSDTMISEPRSTSKT